MVYMYTILVLNGKKLTIVVCCQLLEERDAELERSEASIDGLQKGADARESVSSCIPHVTHL